MKPIKTFFDIKIFPHNIGILKLLVLDIRDLAKPAFIVSAKEKLFNIINMKRHSNKDKNVYFSNSLFFFRIDFKKKYISNKIPSNLNRNSIGVINIIFFGDIWNLLSKNSIKRSNVENKKFSIPRRAWNGIKDIDVNKVITKIFIDLFPEFSEK